MLEPEHAGFIDEWKQKAQRATYKQTLRFYDSFRVGGLVENNEFIAALCKIDRFYLLTSVLRQDAGRGNVAR